MLSLLLNRPRSDSVAWGEFPDGYFIDDLLLFGHFTDRRTHVSRGAEIEVPDLSNADTATVLEWQRQQDKLLRSLGEDHMLQVQWSVESNYSAALAAYEQVTRHQTLSARPHDQWSLANRAALSADLADRQAENRLRRECARIYLTRRTPAPALAHRLTPAGLEAWCNQESHTLAARLSLLGGALGMARVRLMSGDQHFLHYTRFLNPSQEKHLSREPGLFLRGFNPGETILANCARHTVPATLRERARDIVATLAFDGSLHALFVIENWPVGGTYPTMWMSLLRGFVGHTLTVTQNIYPLPVQSTIDHEVDLIEELKVKATGRKRGAMFADEAMEREEKLLQLRRGEALPMKCLTVLRVWDTTEDGLWGRCQAVQSALAGLGFHYRQINDRITALRMFCETLPGWTGSEYRGWDVRVSTLNLRDLLPVSSTFTGALDSADALFHGRQGGVVGLRGWVTDTPQHTIITGTRGSGKTVGAIDLASQTDLMASFTGIVDQGLAWADYAALNGYTRLVIRPESDFTWNYFDTGRAPMNNAVRSDAASLCLRMVGRCADEDRNKLRRAVVGDYIAQLLDDAAESWKRDHVEDYEIVVREAYAIEDLRRRQPAGTSFLEAWSRWREQGGADTDKGPGHSRVASDRDLLTWSKEPDSARTIRDLIFTRFSPADFPTHTGLCSILNNGRKRHHRTGRMAEEVDRLATLLSAWMRKTGVNGRLFDGASNIELAGPGVYVELGYLGEGDGDLRDCAWFLATSRIRQRIVTLPRALKKRVILEEAARLESVHGATAFIEELYAQMRKFNAWVTAIFQQSAQFRDPDFLQVLLGNANQYLFFRQQTTTEVNRMGDIVGLPPAARSTILDYPIPGSVTPDGPAPSEFTYFVRGENGPPLVGTAVCRPNPYLLYVASSNGETFDQRRAALASYATPLEGVLAEVDRKRGKPVATV